MSVIAYSMDRNWAFREVQLAFDEVVHLFFARCEPYIWIIGEGPTYWSKASRTLKGQA